jgi:hypothetical protein
MEDVLDIYERPYDPAAPVVCMDEQPVQLIKETRQPLRARPGQPRRFDFEYERAGTASIFLLTEPLKGWRAAHVRERRRAVDFAAEIAWLLEKVYPDAPVVVLVCDNLNTHNEASLYEAFEPQRARALAARLDIRHTPKHGSWLNVAECELSVMTRQALSGRIGTMARLRRQVAAWEKERNSRQIGVNWQFTTADARTKLRSLYPQPQLS